jgi:hypothetical protein
MDYAFLNFRLKELSALFRTCLCTAIEWRLQLVKKIPSLLHSVMRAIHECVPGAGETVAGGDLIEIGRLRLRDRPLSQGDRAHRFANEGYVNFRRKLDQLGIRYSLIDLADPRYSSARPAARCRKPCSPNPFLLKLGRNPDHVTQVQNTFSGMDTGRFADVLARRIARDGATGMSSARLFLSLLFFSWLERPRLISVRGRTCRLGRASR